MTYKEDVFQVVLAHEDQIEADLVRARQTRNNAASELADAEREVAWLELLLDFGRSTGTEPRASERMTLNLAMRRVLEDSRTGRMRASGIASEIERRGLYRMRDGRPVEAQQIHARVGNNPDEFRREATYIALASGASRSGLDAGHKTGRDPLMTQT